MTEVTKQQQHCVSVVMGFGFLFCFVFKKHSAFLQEHVKKRSGRMVLFQGLCSIFGGTRDQIANIRWIIKKANYSFRLLLVVCRTSLLQFCLTNTSSVMLCETRWTFTGKTSQSVDTQELAIVLFGLTFIKVCNERQASENPSRVIWLCFPSHEATERCACSTRSILSRFLLEALQISICIRQGGFFPTYLSSVNTMSY